MRVLRLLAALSLVLGSFAFATPVAAGDPCYHGFDMPTRTVGTDPQVKMMPCAFAPTIVRVQPGTTVEWFNGPYFNHLVTGANQEWGSRDTEVPADSVVAYRFDKPGVYPYACALHRGMSGVVVVGDGIAAGGPAGVGAAVTQVAPPDAPAATPISTPVATTKAAAAATAAVATAAVKPATTAGAPAATPAPASDRGPAMAVALAIAVAVTAAIAIGIGAIRLVGVRRGSPELPARH